MTWKFTRRDFAKAAGAAAVLISVPAGEALAQATAEPAAAGPMVGPMSASAMKAAMERADTLLRQMTVEEKVMQLSSTLPLALIGTDGLIRDQLDANLKHGIGQISALGLFGHKSPETLAKTTNAIQRYLLTETRLKIPAIFHNEAANGVVAPQFSGFPTPLGLAATWDPAAVEEMADIMRRQLRSIGIQQALAPVMDVARDVRWGRVHETFGEDPYLVSAYSVAFTRGMQGRDLHNGVIPSAKHFLGYAVTEGGQNMAATAVGARELYDVYARPFEAAIRLAGLTSVMASYSEFDGVPIHISRAILTTLLRERMGFTGTVVSDYAGVGWAQTRQRVAADPEEVGAFALAAGMDVELPVIQAYGRALVNAVQGGKVSESLLDESVRRVLRDKFALGLFDDPYVPEDPVAIQAVAREGDSLSQRLAAESVTLLKNETNLLPLGRDTRKVAVIGPFADSTMVGFPAYTYPAALALVRARFTGEETLMAGTDSPASSIPPEAQAALVAEMQDYIKVDLEDYVRSNYPAVSLAEAVRRLLPDATVTVVRGTGIRPAAPTDIPAAVAAAREADAVILYVGGHAAWAGKERTEGEGTDSANIDLPPQQMELVKAVSSVGKPTVTVVSMGRPPSLTPVIDGLPAVLTAYFGGPHQGGALADAIFGVTNPAGKLPVTMPRHSGQVPIHHGQKWGSGYRRTKADPHHGYLDMPSTPLFPFGHGLSYTIFQYGPLQLDSESVDVGGEIRASLTIRNAGGRAGTEVVQLYAEDTATGVTLPAQQLISFARVELEPGASRTVTFTVPLSLLAYTGMSGELMMEPGPVTIAAGSSSDDIRSAATVTVTGRAVTLDGARRAYLSRAEVR
jgi:beta-glucosidase